MPKAFVEVEFGPANIVEKLKHVDEKTITGPLTDAVRHLAEVGQREATSRAPGHLATSIMSDVRPLMATVYTDLKYARTLEGGRHAGRRLPNLDELSQKTGIEFEHIFAVATAIAKRGFKGRFFMRKAKAAVNAAIPGELEKVGREVEHRMFG